MWLMEDITNIAVCVLINGEQVKCSKGASVRTGGGDHIRRYPSA